MRGRAAARVRGPGAFVLRCAVVGALVLGSASWLASPGDPLRATVAGAFGLLVGALAAPGFKPAAFRHPALYQVLCAGAAGAFLGFFLGASVQSVLFGVLVGGVAGWLAPVWLRWLTLP